MPPDRTPAVLHITAAAGGGADRYVRDVAAGSGHRHYLLHTGGGVDVLEDVAARRFTLVDTQDAGRSGQALRRWLAATGIGIVHAHGVNTMARARLDLIDGGLPYVVTLHDLQFLNPRAFEVAGMPPRDATWIAELAPALAKAAAVIVPLPFVATLAQEVAPGARTRVITPGLRASAPAAMAVAEDFATSRPRRVVAIAGAIGPHKGSALIEALANALDGTGIGIVVIGYTDTRLKPGWEIPGRLYVHGPYQDDTLPAWLTAYNADLALFPNRLPETFSYTLSEVWAAGVPVAVPDDGALGERVKSHGGGWRLPPNYDAPEAAALILHLLSDRGADEYARVKSSLALTDPARVPALSTMIREMDALYAHYAVAPSTAPDSAAAQEALAPLLAINLDGFEFRKELINLVGQLEQSQANLEAARQRCAQLEHDGIAWAAKLEADLATLRGEVANERARGQAEVRRVTNEKAQTESKVQRLASEIARIDNDYRHALGEIVRLGRDMVALDARSTHLATESTKVAAFNAELEGELVRVTEQGRALTAALEQQARNLHASEGRERDNETLIAQLRDEITALRRDMTAEIDRLNVENRHLAEHKAALYRLPGFIRRRLLQKAAGDGP